MSFIIKSDPEILFIHIPKTAGNSIYTALSNLYTPIIIPNSKSVNENYHSTYEDAKKYVSNLNNIFKFSVVRNPWSRATSWFFFRKRIIEKNIKRYSAGFKNTTKLENNFEKILKESEYMKTGFPSWLKNFYNQPWDLTWFSLSTPQSFWLKGGNFNAILRFENLQEEFNNLDLFNIKLPHKNKSANTNFQSCYDQESIDLISKINEEDIDNFKYSFKDSE